MCGVRPSPRCATRGRRVPAVLACSRVDHSPALHAVQRSIPTAVGGANGDRCDRCARGDTAFDLAASIGIYDGALRDMVHALKYRQRRMIAPGLSAAMRRSGARVLVGADAVVPVPLHAWRQWQRGFNQADDLARGLGLPVWRVLRRPRRGPPQASLPAGASVER